MKKDIGTSGFGGVGHLVFQWERFNLLRIANCMINWWQRKKKM
jgi:hypothetical protein